MLKSFLFSIFFISVMLLSGEVSTYAQTAAPDTDPASNSDLISIGVLELRSTGGMSEEDVTTINAYLQNSIAGLSDYRVIEQSQMEELIEVYEQQQLSGLYEIGSDQLALTAADQITMGTVGRLFDRVIVSLRLVEITTGEVVFSHTVHSRQDEVFYRLDEIVERVRDHGQLRRQLITLEDIEHLVDRKRYAEAQQRLEQFFRQNRRLKREGNSPQSPDTDLLADLQSEINENLYDDYLHQARRARKRDDYMQARNMITRAIAIEPTADALEERDIIQIDQQEYERERETRRRLAELRAAEAQEQELAGALLSPFDAIKLYYQQLQWKALRLSLATVMYIPPSLEVPEPPGSWGIQYYQTLKLGSEPESPSYIDVQSVAGATIMLEYDRTRTSNLMSGHIALSPHTGFAIKITHLVVTAGLDGGALFQYGSDIEEQYAVHPTAGISMNLDFMLHKSSGVHLGGRLDHIFYLENRTDLFPEENGSPWVLRLFSGVSL